MDIYGQIAQAIRSIVGGNTNGPAIFPAEVKSVEGETCTIAVGGLEVSDVRLRAAINGSGDHLLRIPRVGSQVVVADMSGGQFRDLVAIEQSETERVDIAIGSTTVTIEDGQITINGGDNGGMVQIQELQQNLDNLKTYVENLAIAAAVAMAPMSALDGGTSVTTFNTTQQNLKAAFQWANMENTTVKH